MYTPKYSRINIHLLIAERNCSLWDQTAKKVIVVTAKHNFMNLVELV